MTEFERMREHVGHVIECVVYSGVNASIECCTCSEVLCSIDKDDAGEED